MAHTHWPGGPTCDLPTKKACEDRFADWQAASQVKLAARVVEQGRTKEYRKDSSTFGQLVQVMGGLKETITNQDGVQSEAPFTRRVLRMLELYQSAPKGAVTQEG